MQVEKGRALFLQVTEIGTDFTSMLINITFAFDFFDRNPVYRITVSCIGVTMSKKSAGILRVET